MQGNLPRILVIDSDLDAIELARFALWRSGLPCTFQWFDDAQLANASLLTHALCRTRELPAVILLDPRHFDGAEGYELLHTLCASPAMAHIPLILFTASPLCSDFEHDQQSRIWYAAKPEDPRQYMDIIMRVVQQRLFQPVAEYAPTVA